MKFTRLLPSGVITGWPAIACLTFGCLTAGCLDYDFQEASPTEWAPSDTGSHVATTSTLTTTSTTSTTLTGTGSTSTGTTTTFTPIADAPVYANTSTTLYEVDPATGAATVIGDFADRASGEAIDGFVDIAIDLGGRMFGGTFDALYRIDPTTATVELICAPKASMYALAFTDAGELLAGDEDRITFIDTYNCDTQRLIDGSSYTTSGDLVGLPDGYLYWTIAEEDADGLVRVNPTTGATVYIGSIPGFTNIFGLGYDDGQLYGFNSWGETIRISPEDGTPELIASNDEIQWWGATTNPVEW